ncbi:ParA family protein [Vibrio sp. SNU_ST1]|uniref:ParA family protein n=1 Tax=Vibrio sp. SNU_ST1 TaxID=3064001 RepID=UPI00272A47DF|nr:ParA family protein [Vibrio sp. SNU_ST1]WKY59124.1 ParA family protein [Vibrio sp. SNU_ST1]
MQKYSFWNNKGGTGKTSLAFQAITMYAERNPDARILVVDLCPQANLSELFLGGLIGNGSTNLNEIQNQNPALRCSIGGYFQERLPAPYTMPTALDVHNYISFPSHYNRHISENIHLVAGDALVELQANAMTTLANTQIPGTNTWLSIIDWLNNFLDQIEGEYTHVFVDTNPSFSIYTQIALAATDKMILPVMADDSSRRAVQNAIALVQGINLPSAIYQQHNFATQLISAGRRPPRFHLFPKNRLTQYMGPASAYHSVLTEIDEMVENVLTNHPDVCSFSQTQQSFASIRDFQTTGVVAFAHGMPFTRMTSTRYPMPGRDAVFIRADYLQNCVTAMNDLVNKM